MPYVVHNEFLGGRLTEDWTFRRTFPNGSVATGSVLYHSNGRKAKEDRLLEGNFHPDGYPRYWLDDGREVSGEEFDLWIEAFWRANQ
jgi:hypothetical protein